MPYLEMLKDLASDADNFESLVSFSSSTDISLIKFSLTSNQ